MKRDIYCLGLLGAAVVTMAAGCTTFRSDSEPLSEPAAPAASRSLATPLLGIEVIDDRDTPPTDWNVPKGFDYSGRFGTYQLSSVQACTGSVLNLLTSWANEHSVGLELIENETNRVVVHGRIRDQRGFFEFRYRVFSRPNRAIVSGTFIDPSGAEVSAIALSRDLVKRFELETLADSMLTTLNCLNSPRGKIDFGVPS